MTIIIIIIIIIIVIYKRLICCRSKGLLSTGWAKNISRLNKIKARRREPALLCCPTNYHYKMSTQKTIFVFVN